MEEPAEVFDWIDELNVIVQRKQEYIDELEKENMELRRQLHNKEINP